MLIIKGTQDIYISRGDIKNIGVNLIQKEDGDTDDYEMTDTEYLIMRVWDKGMNKVIKTLQTSAGSSIFGITAAFTQDLCGDLLYSVDLIYANGTKETVIGKSPSTAPKFVVLEA